MTLYDLELLYPAINSNFLGILRYFAFFGKQQRLNE